MSEKLSDSITKTVVDYVAKIHETEDEYIYETIEPFCRDTLKRTISKKELEEMLLRAEQMKWIPCSERLPDREALCCDRVGYMLVGYVKEENGRYIAETDDDYLICVAWMLLPEPYKEKKDGN